MPASVHDVSSMDDWPTIPDEFDDEDSESDYHSCGSYISDDDEGCTEEDYEARELEIFQWNKLDLKWEPIQASEVEDLVGASPTSIEWISRTEFKQWSDATTGLQERNLDALAVLAETVGGVATVWWQYILLDREKSDVRMAYFLNLQFLLFLIMTGRGAWTDTCWCRFHIFYIPSQQMWHQSFTSSLLSDGSIVFDCSPDRPWKDLMETMRIALPYFREMNARIDALSKLQNVGYSSSSSDSASILGSTNMTNLITCLDIAESIAKLVPGFGNVLEGACAILRKTIQAAENAKAARDECRALAEHTVSITLAILSEIGPASTLSGADINRICDLRETIKIVDSRVESLSKLGRLKYIVSRGRINAEVMDLRAQVDNARIAFNIRSDISTTRLLTNLTKMQTRLESRVDDLCEGQKMTHHMLRTILVKVQGRKTGDAYVEEVN